MSDFPSGAFDAWLTTPPRGHYTEDGPEINEADTCACGHAKAEHNGRVEHKTTNPFWFDKCSWESEDEICLCHHFEQGGRK